MREVEVDVCLPMIGADERQLIVDNLKLEGFSIVGTTEKLMESLDHDVALIAITWAVSKVLDGTWASVSQRFIKASRRIKKRLLNHNTQFEIVVRFAKGRVIYNLPTTINSKAVIAIEGDASAVPVVTIAGDNRSWEAGEWISAQRYLHDPAYKKRVLNLLAQKDTKVVKKTKRERTI